MASKVCTKCGEDKAFSEYTKMKIGRFGLRPTCKPCTNLGERNRRNSDLSAHRERERLNKAKPGQKAKRTKYRLDNPEVYRGATKRYRVKNRDKIAARAATRNARLRGKLVRPDKCERCPAPATEAHHPDYTKPLVVDWLCQPCHKIEHRKEAA